MPFGKAGSDAGSQIIKGWTLSGIYTADSGRPYATFLSLPSAPFTNTDGTLWNGYGGVLGQGGLNILPTVPRNNNIGRNNFRVDLRLGRDFKATEKLTIQVLAEGFNIANHSNWTNYNNTAYIGTAPASSSGIGTPIPLAANATFGLANGDGSQPDGTNARRFQLALRFRF